MSCTTLLKHTVLILTTLLITNQRLYAQTCESQIPPTTPSSRFIIHNNGTVTDKRTGLIWKRCLEGVSGAACNSGTPVELNWQDALQRARDASFEGRTDWRLPNIKELRSIVEQQCVDPAINLSVFPAQAASVVWSSSPNADVADNAWNVYFSNGFTFNGSRNVRRQVWLVRGGQ